MKAKIKKQLFFLTSLLLVGYIGLTTNNTKDGFLHGQNLKETTVVSFAKNSHYSYNPLEQEKNNSLFSEAISLENTEENEEDFVSLKKLKQNGTYLTAVLHSFFFKNCTNKLQEKNYKTKNYFCNNSIRLHARIQVFII